MKEYRCRSCNHLLFKANGLQGEIEVKCTNGRCRAMNVFDHRTVYTSALVDKIEAAAVR